MVIEKQGLTKEEMLSRIEDSLVVLFHKDDMVKMFSMASNMLTLMCDTFDCDFNTTDVSGKDLGDAVDMAKFRIFHNLS